MEMELYEFGRLIRRRWLWISLATVLLVTGAAVWSYFLTEPQYEATTKLLVQSQTQNNQLFSVDQLVANQKLLTTYGEIIKSNQIADDVIGRLNLHMSAAALLSKVKVKSAADSLITSVTVTDNDPQQAVAIANAFASSFSGNLNSILKVDNVSILDEAKLIAASVPVSPRPVLNIGVALVLGLLIGIGGALLMEHFDRSFKSEEEVEDLVGLPVLGVIATFDKVSKEKGDD
ncbi:MAG: Wzz/FepE/Etk N-terminal domain-containing protein [Tumebacillaceae bacterium]